MNTKQWFNRRESESIREANDIRAKIEVERTKITNEREALSAERLAAKADREQLAADRGKMAEGRGVLEREMKQMRDLALDLENKAAEVSPKPPRAMYIFSCFFLI